MKKVLSGGPSGFDPMFLCDKGEFTHATIEGEASLKMFSQKNTTIEGEANLKFFMKKKQFPSQVFRQEQGLRTRFFTKLGRYQFKHPKTGEFAK